MSNPNVPVPVDAQSVNDWQVKDDGSGKVRQFLGHASETRQHGRQHDATICVHVHGFQHQDGRINRLIDIQQWFDDDDIDDCEIYGLTSHEAHTLGEMLLSMARRVMAFEENDGESPCCAK